jgi:hypothetical protein
LTDEKLLGNLKYSKQAINFIGEVCIIIPAIIPAIVLIDSSV